MALLRPDIEEILENYLESKCYEFIYCGSGSLDNVSAGFLSSTNKAVIRYRTQDGEKDLYVFIKTLPQSPYHRENVIAIGGYHREVVLFKEVLANFHSKLQDNTIPKCLLARSDLIVMEDMTKKGFKNKDLKSTFDLFECEKTLEALAKFHLCSLITERQEERKMTELLPIIKTEVLTSKDENHIGMKACFASIKALKISAEQLLSSQYSADVMKRAFEFLENIADGMKSSKLYPNVLSHSDMWSNNIMLRHGEDGRAQEACLLDFQLATYKTPAYDVLVFLHNCTDIEFRNKHYDHLMKHYYNFLSGQLTSFGIDIEDLMTWDDFQYSILETLPIALAQCCLCLHFVLMPEDILKEVMVSDTKFKVYYEEDRTSYALEAMKRPEYGRRITEALTNFLNYFV